jgi:hypothetical protein
MSISTLSAQRAVLDGRFAEAAVGGVVIGFLTDWEVKVTTKTADTTAHGDAWEYNQPLVSGWTFSAKQYMPVASASHTINALYSSGAVPAQVTIAGYSGAAASQGGSLSSDTKIFEGTGTPTSAGMTFPMTLATQEFECQGTGPPTTGV